MFTSLSQDVSVLFGARSGTGQRVKGFFTEHNCLLCLKTMLFKAMWVHETPKLADQKDEMTDAEMFISTECDCTFRWQLFLWVFVMTNTHIHLTNCKILILVGAMCAAVKHKDPVLSLRLHNADTSERGAGVAETEITSHIKLLYVVILGKNIKHTVM